MENVEKANVKSKKDIENQKERSLDGTLIASI